MSTKLIEQMAEETANFAFLSPADEAATVWFEFDRRGIHRFTEAIVQRCADSIDREAARFAAAGQQDMRDFQISKLAILAEFGIEK